LLFTAFFFILGFLLFVLPTQPPRVEAPRGPITVGAGPYPETEINKTEVTVSIPESSVDVKVTIKFNESRTYFAYVLLPFLVSDVSPYIIYQQSVIHRDLLSGIGNLSSNYMNSVLGSSIANVTFQPNITAPGWWFIPPDYKAELTLAITLKASSTMVAITDLFGASETVIITFFGNLMGVYETKMGSYMSPTSRQTLDWPFTVFLQLPASAYLSGSFPPPVEYYVKEEHRWVMFSLDFLDGRYAQTVSCSYTNPIGQSLKEVMIFSGGISIGLGGSLLLDLIRPYIEPRKEPRSASSEHASISENLFEWVPAVARYVSNWIFGHFDFASRDVKSQNCLCSS